MTHLDMTEPLAPLHTELGKALHVCQIFESSLCLLLALLAHERADGASGAFQASWDFHSQKTLGHLLKALRAQVEVPDDIDDYLDMGISKRNQIVHGFMTRNTARLFDAKARLEVEAELSALKKEVRRRDIAVTKLIDALIKKYGLSTDALRGMAHDWWNHKNPGPPLNPS